MAISRAIHAVPWMESRTGVKFREAPYQAA
jgi:hypothetical protein